MKRAGDVIGTPDWQVDLMVQNERERAWERLNAQTVIDYGKTAELIKTVVNDLVGIRDTVGDACCEADGTPVGQRLIEIHDWIDSIREELRHIMKEVKE